jgi:catechol 2,3-dioxygenase-like lactoylglutathione lyase family enzyme
MSTRFNQLPGERLRLITGIDHVQITVAPGDVEEARAFYCGVLGLREIEKPEVLKGRGGFWLQVGNQQLHIGVEDVGRSRLSKAHVAYATSDLDTCRARLSAANVPVLEGVPIPGFCRLEFRDPFGNRVELIQPLRKV